MKAIETTYAGIRFRSRLEARWAVFFNHLGIAWQYEAQGYECALRLFMSSDPTWATRTFGYLPDFWLPELGLYAEVKGSLTVPETEKLLHAAAYLSTAGGGGCHDGGGHDLVVLGDVPQRRRVQGLGAVPSTWMPLPIRLHMHKGSLYGDPISLAAPERHPRCTRFTYDIADDWGATNYGDGSVTAISELLLKGSPPRSCGLQYPRALDAARSARFEHGQSGGWSA